jgi:hypothetical protein
MGLRRGCVLKLEDYVVDVFLNWKIAPCCVPKLDVDVFLNWKITSWMCT